MDFSISQTAHDAEEACAALQLFVDSLPEERNLSDGLEDLVTASACLRSLDQEYPRFARSSRRLQQDVDLVLRSLNYSLDKVKEMFRQTRYRRPNGTRPYRRAWDDLCVEFRDEEGGPTFGARMQTYAMFIKGILDSCRGALEIGEMQYHRQWISRLVEKQESIEGGAEDNKFNQSFATLSFGGPPAGFPQMPSMPPMPPLPNYRIPPVNPLPYPSGPAWGTGRDAKKYRPPSVPPAVPDPPPLYPTSPTHSNSTQSSNYTQSSNNSSLPPIQSGHWAAAIFDGKHANTSFRSQGAQTECYGRPEVDLLTKLKKESFNEVLRLSFESADVTARFYWRANDHRARILLSTADARGRSVRYCIPLTALKLVRRGNCLELNRMEPTTGHFQCWANLQFDVYERLVLFYCAFAGMKSQDHRPYPVVLQDYFNTTSGKEEDELFAGVIEDANYFHALRLFADKDSGGFRLETKACRGAMRRTPIWTAFCTRELLAPDFVIPVGPKTILVRRLKFYVFCDGYVPLGGEKSGQVLLRFTKSDDALDFIEVVQSLRKQRTR